MGLLEVIKLAFVQLVSNKWRTLLTMLGMFIGIGAIIMILSLGDGLTDTVMSSFNEMGMGVFQISSKSKNTEDYITQEEMDIIKEMPEVEMLVAADTTNAILYNEKQDEFNISLMGIEPEFNKDIMPKKVLAGRLLEDYDEKAKSPTIVISDVTAMALFNCKTNYESVLGKTINISVNNQLNTFTVVGIVNTNAQTHLTTKELEKQLASQTYYTSYSTIGRLLGTEGKIGMIAGLTYEEYDQNVATTKMGQILNRKHHTKDGFEITTYATMLTMVEAIMGTITLFISALAGISLLVGGVGIMNIMLVTVKERTREIGIRKALGAPNWVILRQFIIEALMLTTIAGIIGVVLGYVGALIVGDIINITASFTVGMMLFASLTSVGIGLVFGVYPAYQASKLDPIEALRAE